LLVGPRTDKRFDNICPRRYRRYSARTGSNIIVRRWEITDNNLNVEISDVKKYSQLIARGIRKYVIF
jgi:hypothetical protein